MNRRGRVWVAWTVGIACGFRAEAAVLHVPEEHPSLTAAVRVAGAGDEIELAPGTYSPSATREEFPIRLAGKSICIRGAGALATRLDAEGKSRLFVFVAGDSSHLEDVALIEGRAPEGGAAALIEGAAPRLARVVVTECEGSADGDALCIRRGDPEILNCLFIANGGSGPTICVEAGAPTFERCTWSTNAGPALELRGLPSAQIRHSVVANPGIPRGRGVGLVILASGEQVGPDLADNLFGGCTGGAIRVEGLASVELAATLEAARAARGLTSADVRFVDATRGDFRLEPGGVTGDRDVGAFSGSTPMLPPPAPFGGHDADARSGDTLLGPSVPNPFAPRTTIHFHVPRPSVVDLGVYNILGQRMRTLQAGDVGGGDHTREWDGRDDRGEEVPPGIYFVRITIGDVTESRRLVLVR